MARRQYDLLVGLFALGAILVLGYMILQFGGGARRYGDTIEVVGEFNQAGGLIKDAPVYISGVDSGRVTRIEVAPTGKVLVYMAVARQAGLRVGDVPEIAQIGVLGDVIVNFILGEERGAPAGKSTLFVGKDPVDIIKQADEVLKVFTSEKTVGSLRAILDNIEQLTGTENQALVSQALENLTRVTAELEQDMANVRELFNEDVRRDIQTIIANTRAASADLPELTRETTLILRETRTHLIQLAENLSENAEHFNNILAAVDEILATTARGDGTLGRLIKDPAMYDSTVTMLDAVRDAVTAIKYHGPIWGSRVRAAEEAAAAEEVKASTIWRR
ncbi:MAG: MCE family protein [Verrucomicrobia bacterium]|nr:MCE family protein [Verrucomicrobiota bacterium]